MQNQSQYWKYKQDTRDGPFRHSSIRLSEVDEEVGPQKFSSGGEPQGRRKSRQSTAMASQRSSRSSKKKETPHNMTITYFICSLAISNYFGCLMVYQLHENVSNDGVSISLISWLTLVTINLNEVLRLFFKMIPKKEEEPEFAQILVAIFATVIFLLASFTLMISFKYIKLNHTSPLDILLYVLVHLVNICSFACILISNKRIAILAQPITTSCMTILMGLIFCYFNRGEAIYIFITVDLLILFYSIFLAFRK